MSGFNFGVRLSQVSKSRRVDKWPSRSYLQVLTRRFLPHRLSGGRDNRAIDSRFTGWSSFTALPTFFDH